MTHLERRDVAQRLEGLQLLRLGLGRVGSPGLAVPADRLGRGGLHGLGGLGGRRRHLGRRVAGAGRALHHLRRGGGGLLLLRSLAVGRLGGFGLPGPLLDELEHPDPLDRHSKGGKDAQAAVSVRVGGGGDVSQSVRDRIRKASRRHRQARGTGRKNHLHDKSGSRAPGGTTGRLMMMGPWLARRRRAPITARRARCAWLGVVGCDSNGGGGVGQAARRIGAAGAWGCLVRTLLARWASKLERSTSTPPRRERTPR